MTRPKLPFISCRDCGRELPRGQMRIHRWAEHRRRIHPGGRIWDDFRKHPPTRGWVRAAR